MSSDSPSDVDDAVKPSGRRVEFRTPISYLLRAGEPEALTDLPTPLAAASALSSHYIATLHIGLMAFLTKFTDLCLKAYSVYYHSSMKNKEMRHDSARVPTSVKKI